MESICTKLQNKGHVAETQRRAKFKFPGCQQIPISKKCSFTKCDAVNLKASRLESSSSNTAVGSNAALTCGPLDRGGPCTHGDLRATPPHSRPPIKPTFCQTNKQKKKYYSLCERSGTVSSIPLFIWTNSKKTYHLLLTPKVPTRSWQ